MFFQNVTHSFPTCHIIIIRNIVFAPLSHFISRDDSFNGGVKKLNKKEFIGHIGK